MKPVLVQSSRAPHLGALLDEAEAIARELPADDVEAILGRGAKLEGLLSARLSALAAGSASRAVATLPAPVEAPTEPDRPLSVEEASKLLGMSPWWVRKNKESLGCIRVGSGRYKFSAVRLKRWIARRTA